MCSSSIGVIGRGPLACTGAGGGAGGRGGLLQVNAQHARCRQKTAQHARAHDDCHAKVVEAFLEAFLSNGLTMDLAVGAKMSFSAAGSSVLEAATAAVATVSGPGQRHWPCTDRGDRSGAELKSGVLVRGG